jgi:hypothetical protein
MPRDPAKTPAYFMKVARLYRGAIAAAIKLDSSAVLTTIADYHLHVARALYSAGAPINECVSELASAAEFFERDLAANAESPLSGISNLAPYLEYLSAARLSDRFERFEKRLRNAPMTGVPAWQQSVLSLTVAAFGSQTKLATPLAKNGADPMFGPRFTDVFLAVLERDHSGFPGKLELYLTKDWGPRLDRGAKEDMSSTPASYTGKWLFFSAALCAVMGDVPALSAKAMQYVPVELIELDKPTRPGRDKAASGAKKRR